MFHLYFFECPNYILYFRKKVAATASPENEGEGDDGEGESADEEYLLKPGKKKVIHSILKGALQA